MLTGIQADYTGPLYRSYALFPITFPIAGHYTSAVLRLTSPLIEQFPGGGVPGSHQLDVWDVNGGMDPFVDFGTGNLYGQGFVTSGTSIDIPLSAQALAAINSRTTDPNIFTVGVSPFDIGFSSPELEALADPVPPIPWIGIFPNGFATGSVQLLLDTAQPAPEPATLGLFLTGLAGFVAARRRCTAS